MKAHGLKRAISSSLFLICLAIGCPIDAHAETWVELGTFPRFVLYVDSDSVKWTSRDEVEIRQKTVLTEAGKSYFQRGYEERGIKEPPPATVVTLERYTRSHQRTTLSQALVDSDDNIIVRSDAPTTASPIQQGSLYDAAWKYLFVLPEIHQRNDPDHRTNGPHQVTGTSRAISEPARYTTKEEQP